MVRLETKIDQDRRDLLRSRLRATNTAASPALRALRGTVQDREVPLQLWALDDDGELLAGLDAYTWARWLHINLLWVHESRRASGLGSRLLAATEEEARTGRGCGGSRVCTWDFQAPDFYRRYGYRVVCELPGYPAGVTEYTMVKKL